MAVDEKSILMATGAEAEVEVARVDSNKQRCLALILAVVGLSVTSFALVQAWETSIKQNGFSFSRSTILNGDGEEMHHLGSPREVIGVLQEILDSGSQCSVNYTVSTNMTGVFVAGGPNFSEGQIGFRWVRSSIYPRYFQMDWWDAPEFFELVLNSLCCGLNFSSWEERYAACACMMGYAVAFPVNSYIAPYAGFIAAESAVNNEPLGRDQFIGGTLDQIELTEDNIVNIVLPTAIQKHYKTTTVCSIENPYVIMELKEELRNPYGMCRLMASNANMTRSIYENGLGCTLCSEGNASGSLAAGNCNPDVFKPSAKGGLVTEKNICGSHVNLRAFFNAILGASVLFNNPRTTETACGLTQLGAMPNNYYLNLHRGAAHAEILSFSQGNKFWEDNQQDTCGVLFSSNEEYEQFSAPFTCRCPAGTPKAGYDPCSTVAR